jgi:hypothetical protein
MSNSHGLESTAWMSDDIATALSDHFSNIARSSKGHTLGMISERHANCLLKLGVFDFAMADGCHVASDVSSKRW